MAKARLITGVTAKIPGGHPKPKRKAEQSPLEQAFWELWQRLAGDDWEVPVRQFKFHPKRKWKFDFAWPLERLAVEMEGGVFSYPVTCDKCDEPVERTTKTGKKVRVRAPLGGHTTNTNFQNDCEKYNTAARLGWVVLRYTRKDIDDRPVQVIEEVLATLNQEAVVEEERGVLFDPPRKSTRERAKELFG